MNQESRNIEKNLRNAETTEQIIAAAIRVHRELGPGFLESIYKRFCRERLNAKGNTGFAF